MIHLPPPPKRLYNLCYSFLLNITVVSTEIKNISYAKLWGVGGPRCTKADVQMANDFSLFPQNFLSVTFETIQNFLVIFYLTSSN